MAEERKQVYFVADVHLGLKVGDPAEREARFLQFLGGIDPAKTRALYLLGDIWDFWYEYRDVIPHEGIRVVHALMSLMDAGIEVYFFPGNHDIWCYRFFERIGIHKMEQPSFQTLDGRTFCLGHGDELGRPHHTFLYTLFHSRIVQTLFSTLHPWIAYRFALAWSDSNRRGRKQYVFSEDAPLYRFALETSAERPVGFFVFGHYHVDVDRTLPGGGRFVILKDWIGEGRTPYAVFDGQELSVF